MGTVGIVTEIGVFVIWIGIVGNALTNSKLQIPFKEIEIIMGVHTKMFPKGRVPHVLIHKGKSGIRIAIVRFPVLFAKPFTIEPQNESCRMCCN